MRSGLAAWQRVERVFQDIERENQLILRAAGEGIYGVNAEGKTTFVNPAAERMLGWAAEELVGKAIHPIVHHSHHDGQSLPGRGLPDLCRVPRRRRAQCRRRGVLAQGRLAGLGRIHVDADPRPRHGGRRRDRVSRRQPAARGRREAARRAGRSRPLARAAGTGKRLSAGRNPDRDQSARHHRPERGDPEDAAPGQAGGADHRGGHDHRRIRHRQGADRARHPRGLRAGATGR